MNQRMKRFQENNRRKESDDHENKTIWMSVKQELLRRLSEMTVQDFDYKIPEFFTKCHARDSVVLLVEGKEIHASKQILRIASPVFKSMLDSEFREKTMDTIELPGKPCPEIVLLLSCLYPNMLQQIIDEPVTRDKLEIKLSAHEIMTMLRGSTLKYFVKIENWHQPAECLLPVFGKLNVLEIEVNTKTGHGTVLFSDTDSTAVACSMDGEMISGERIRVNTDTEVDEDDENINRSFWKRPKLNLNESEKLEILLRLADEYQIESIRRLCEEKYICQFMEDKKSSGDKITLDILVKLLDLAEKHRFTRLLEHVCLKAKQTEVKKMEAEPLFWRLAIDTRYKIYSSKFERLEKELNRKRYGHHGREKEKKPHFPKVIKQDSISDEQFMKGDQYMSFKIQVGGANFYASKEVLALSSDVFKNKIEQLSDSEILDFPDGNPEDFLCLLRSIHPNFVSGITGSNALRILVLSDVYQIRCLAQECDVVLYREFESLLIKPPDSLSEIPSSIHDHIHSKNALTVCRLVVTAAKHNLTKLKRRCCESLSDLEYKEVKSIIEVGEDLIPKSVKLQLLSRYLNTAEDYVGNYRVRDLFRDEEREDSTNDTFEEQEFRFRKSIDDVQIIAEGKLLYADEDILAIASPELHQRIVTNAENQRCIVLTDGSYEEVEMFLRCIYPNILAKVEEPEAIKLLAFADRFKVSVLANICEEAFLKILPERFSSSTIVDLIRKAEKYNMPRLLKKCQSILEKKLGEHGYDAISGARAINKLLLMNYLGSLDDDRYYSSDDYYYDDSD